VVGRLDPDGRELMQVLVRDASSFETRPADGASSRESIGRLTATVHRAV
jgi:hypothetical protein